MSLAILGKGRLMFQEIESRYGNVKTGRSTWSSRNPPAFTPEPGMRLTAAPHCADRRILSHPLYLQACVIPRSMLPPPPASGRCRSGPVNCFLLHRRLQLAASHVHVHFGVQRLRWGVQQRFCTHICIAKGHPEIVSTTMLTAQSHPGPYTTDLVPQAQIPHESSPPATPE